MLLSSDQYRRGLVKWWGDTEATVVTGSRDGSVKSTPMVDQTGSVPDILVEGGGHLEVIPTASDVITPPFRVVEDRVVGDEIEAQGFDTELGTLHLLGMIAPGHFDRLVVSVRYLRWDDGWVVRVDDAMVRLANRMLLERESDTSFVHADEHQSIYTGTVSTHMLEGWFLDIIAPQTIGEHREIVFSILGLLGLVLSDAAVGDVVQLDRLASKPTSAGVLTDREVRFPQHTIPSAPNRTLRMPRPVREGDLQEFDRLLTCVLDDIALRDDVLLPLREYERALRTENEIDRYKAAVIGIDSLLTRRSKRLGFVSELSDLLADSRVREGLAPLRENYPDDQVDRILNRALDKNPSTKDRFNHVAENIELDDEARATFREVIRDRGDVMHGNTGVIKEGLPKKAVDLLAALLKAIIRGTCEAGS